MADNGGRVPGPLIVLVEPQDIVNIASVVRIGKNFDVDGVRLVQPQIYDPYRIEGIAHNTGDLIERIEIYDTLADALRDCVHAVALTARERAAKRRTVGPRDAAAELVEARAGGPVAIVAGREDKGLTNAELDLCRALSVVPTNPGYRSLNLAQAVAIQAYEVWQERSGGRVARKPPRRQASLAPSDQLEWLFRDWESALHRIDFFKTRQADHVLRSLREMVFRARLDAREAALFRAMGIEVSRQLDRIEEGDPAGPSEGTKGER